MKRTASKGTPTGLAQVEALAKLAHRYKLTSVSCDGASIVVDPSAWAPAPAKPEDVAKVLAASRQDQICQCGHSYDEHNEAGCLQGCSLGKCAPKEE